MPVSHPLRLFIVNTSPPSSPRPLDPPSPLPSLEPIVATHIPIEATLGICPLLSPRRSLISWVYWLHSVQPLAYLAAFRLPILSQSPPQTPTPTTITTTPKKPSPPSSHAILYAHHLPRVTFRIALQSCTDRCASVVIAPPPVPRRRLFRLTPVVPVSVAPRHLASSNHSAPCWILQPAPGIHAANPACTPTTVLRVRWRHHP